MKLKYLHYFAFITLFFVQGYAQEKNKIYFDSEWKKTTKDKAKYYRILPLETKGDKVLIKGYYISGKPQMKGLAYNDDKVYNDGLLNYVDGEDISWYFENGNLQVSCSFFHGDLHGHYTEYYENGKVREELYYLNGNKQGKASYFNKDGKLLTSFVYQNDEPYDGITNCFSVYEKGKLKEEKLFYENTNQLAYEAYYKENTIAERFYYKNGDRINQVGGYKKQKGNTITFYPSEKCGYVIGIKHLKAIRKDMPEWNEFFYDPDGKIRFKGKNKHGGPFEGTFYKKNVNFLSGETDVLSFSENYKQQRLINEKAYINDSLIANCSYVDNKPLDGKVVYYGRVDFDNRYLFIITPLKNGYVHGKQSLFEKVDDIRRNRILSYFHYQNGKKEGKSSVYDRYYEENFDVIYKNDKPYKGIIVDSNSIYTYDKGKVIKEKRGLQYKNHYYFEIYQNNIKTTIGYDFDDDNGDKIESGTFKNNKPFNGYFLDTKSKKITLDYYKNGIKKGELLIKYIENEEEIMIDDN